MPTSLGFVKWLPFRWDEAEAMVLREHSEVNRYLESVGEFLRAREVENAYLLGLLESSPAQVPAFMAEVRRGPEILMSACWRESNLLLARGSQPHPEAIALVVESLKRRIPGVVGPAHEAELFAQAWSEFHRCTVRLVMDQLIYRLVRVQWPQSPPTGFARPVGPQDEEVLADWLYQFTREALPTEAFSRKDALESAHERLAFGSPVRPPKGGTSFGPPDGLAFGSPVRPPKGGTYVWEVGGEAVAMAALTRPTARGIMVNAVFTPPEQRRRGYASALVAAISAEGLAWGKEYCVLYTDTDNSTSNAIYRKIGYELVGNSRNYQFRYR